MAVWLARAGSHGEYEAKFLQESRVFVTWDRLDVNLGEMEDRGQLSKALTQRYPDSKPKTIMNWVSQVWPFAHEIAKGDLVVLPLKVQRAIQIGEVVSEYHYEPGAPNPFFHWRAVKWIGEALPRGHFGKDLLNSFGAFMTICRIQRNKAEARIAAMRANGWKPESIAAVTKTADTTEAEVVEDLADTDLSGERSNS